MGANVRAAEGERVAAIKKDIAGESDETPRDRPREGASAATEERFRGGTDKTSSHRLTARR